jgi:hypothetical protein
MKSRKIPEKVIARIKICGVIQYTVTNLQAPNFVRPTPEQIKNLHDLFCIDVELVDEETQEGNSTL